MKKNVRIGGLLAWNLILTAVLLYVLATWRRPASALVPNGNLETAKATEENGPQEFNFQAGQRLNSDVAPQIANRGLAITARLDAQDQDGVIIAQGGLAHGYALYVQNGELVFAARRNQTPTTVSAGKLAAGRHTIRANWTKAGDLTLAVDGGPPATAKAGGAMTVTPTDGLDVG